MAKTIDFVIKAEDAVQTSADGAAITRYKLINRNKNEYIETSNVSTDNFIYPVDIYESKGKMIAGINWNKKSSPYRSVQFPRINIFNNLPMIVYSLKTNKEVREYDSIKEAENYLKTFNQVDYDIMRDKTAKRHNMH